MLPVPALAQLTWGTNGTGGNGTWNSTNTNWYNGTSNVSWVSGDVATFPGVSSIGVVTITGTQIASELIFLPDTGSGTYLLHQGTIEGAVGGLIIQSAAGAGPTINSEIIGGSVTTQGTGLLLLGGANTYTGGLTISNGSIVFLSNGHLGTGGVLDNGFLAYGLNAPVTEANVITGTGTVENYGSGLFTLDAANTFSGGTIFFPNSSNTISEADHSTVLSTVGGTTTIANGPFGTGSLWFDKSGTFTNTLEDNGTAITLANSLILSGNVAFASAGNGSLHFDGTTLSTRSTVTLTSTVNLTVSNTTTIADNISGNFALTQSGTGTLILTGTSTNTVGMVVTSGNLLVNNATGSATGSGTFALSNGAKLGGTGKISSTANAINGTVQGGAPGLTTSGSLTLTSSGTTTFGSSANLVFNLAAIGGSNELNVSNSAVLFSGSTLTINLVDTSTTNYTAGSLYQLIAGTGGANQFSGITVDGSNRISGLTLNLTGTALNGQANSIYYGSSYLVLNGGNIDIVVVPEPGTWALLLGGLACLILERRRRSQGNLLS